MAPGCVISYRDARDLIRPKTTSNAILQDREMGAKSASFGRSDLLLIKTGLAAA